MPVSFTINRSTHLQTDNDLDGYADAGDVLRHTLTIHNIGDTDATSVVLNDLLGGSTETGLMNISPIAFNDAFTAVGNTALRVGGAANIGTGPSSQVAGNLLSNDFGSTTIGAGALAGDDVTGFTIDTVNNALTAGGGHYSIFADGSFNYISEAGDQGTDSFTYTIRDAGINGIAGDGDDTTSTATVTITITGQVWYVDGSAATDGDGTSSNPFNTLTHFAGAGGVDGNGDTIYVKGAATGNLALETGEHLIGTGSTLSVAGFTLAGNGANSSIGASSGTVVTLGSNNEVAGLNVAGTGTALGIGGTNFGNLTIHDSNVSGATGAINLADGASSSSVALSNLNLSSTGSDVLAVDGTTGSGLLSVTGFSNVTINGGNGEIGGALLAGVVFDADPGAAGFQTVSGGTFTAGTIAARVGGYGLLLDEVSGSLDFDATNIAVTRASNPIFGGNVSVGIYATLGINTGSRADFGTGAIDVNSVASSGQFHNGVYLEINNGNSAGFSGDLDAVTTGGAGALRARSLGGGAGTLFLGGSDNDLSASGTGNSALILSSVSVQNGSGGSAAFDSLTENGGSAAISLSSITTPAPLLFGAVTANNTTINALALSNAGSVTFTGAVDINNATGGGVNAGAFGAGTLTFAGGLDIQNSGSTGFNLGGGATLALSGANNNIATTNGTALNVNNAILGNGAGGAGAFNNVSATGTAGGIAMIFASGALAFNGQTTISGSGDSINIVKSNAGTLSLDFVGDLDINTSGTGVRLSNGAGTLNFSVQNTGSTITSTGPSTNAAFVLSSGAGTVSSAATMTSNGLAAQIESRTGGSVNISGSFTTGSGIQASNNSGGTLTFSGASKVITEGGVNLFNNTGAAINFTNGGLHINTTANIGFSATGGGTISVTGTGNTINSVSATALNVVNTGIGANRLNFESISAGNNTAAADPQRGIFLLDTTGPGGLTITGNGTPGSGGTIQNTTNAGIWLVDTGSASISWMNITGVGAEGVTYNANSGTRYFIFTNNQFSNINYPIDIVTGAINAGTVVNAHISGNSGADGIQLSEFSGDITISQASFAALSTANGGATIFPTGTITFGVPVNPLMASAPPPLSDAPGEEPNAEPQSQTPVVPADPTEGIGGGVVEPTNPVGGPAVVQFDPPPTNQPTVIDDGKLSQAELNLIVGAAIDRWAAAGATAEELAAMRAVVFSVENLSGLYLGSSSAGHITLDSDAAGFSWFSDATPGEDSEFSGQGTDLHADPASTAGVRIDLLTTVMHELGHQIGLGDSYLATDRADLMYGTIDPGERRLPDVRDVALATGAPNAGTAFALSPVNLGTIPAGRTVTVQWDSTVNAFTNQVVPTFNNTSSVSGSNFSTVTSNVEVLGPGSLPLALDSLTLGDLVFLDANGNGAFDGGDSGINGVALTLFADTNNNGVFDAGTDVQLATTTTAGGGLYSFSNLSPGNYLVRVDAANFTGGVLAGLVAATGGSDPDDNVNNDNNGASAAGGIVVSQAITLAQNGETTADGTGKNDINNSLDFGFSSPNAAPVAVADNYSTNEDMVLNVAAPGVLGNDTDADGGAKTVVSVNGNVADVGVPVTLASGAKVTLMADGTLTYDPNHAFDTLTSTASGEIGAVNTSKIDSFTYALNGGSSTTVNVTVNGVVSPEDHLEGDAGNNVITGTPNGDFFDLSQGGNDTALGLGGNDGYYYGAAYTSADVINDSGGTNDQIGLQGNYSGGLTLGTIAGIDAIVVLPGFSYNITTVDANVTPGGILKVQATQLAAGQSLTFNGAAEHDGSFLIFGGNGNDTFTGGDGNDGFYFGPGGFNSSDVVNGGAGTNDQLGLDGDYTITLGGNLTGIEVVVLLHGPTATPNHFNITAADTLVASGQTMTIFGLQTETGITFNGAAELDGAFKIYGGTAADILTGGHGADWLFGGNGADSLTGGAGNDIFSYDDVAQSTVAAADTITDFAAGDKIDLSGIDAITGGANDAFNFIASGAFTHTAGELRVENTAGSTWLVQGDTNGDGVADFQLTFTNSDSHPVTSADFTL